MSVIDFAQKFGNHEIVKYLKDHKIIKQKAPKTKTKKEKVKPKDKKPIEKKAEMPPVVEKKLELPKEPDKSELKKSATDLDVLFQQLIHDEKIAFDVDAVFKSLQENEDHLAKKNLNKLFDILNHPKLPRVILFKAMFYLKDMEFDNQNKRINVLFEKMDKSLSATPLSANEVTDYLLLKGLYHRKLNLTGLNVIKRALNTTQLNWRRHNFHSMILSLNQLGVTANDLKKQKLFHHGNLR